MARALNQRARIVVVSSSTGSAHRTRIKKEGAFELLDKPLRQATLLQVARDALKRRPAKKREEVSKA
jgi:FixJ family two-component response regulator